MSNDSSETPIAEKFLRQGDLFGLKFAEGAMFFEVDAVVENQFKPYNIGKVDPLSSTEFDIPSTDGGDNILEIDSRSANRVIHTALGHSPEPVRRYTNYPQGDTRLRKMPNSSIGNPKPSNGADFGYVEGTRTPYSEPTDVEELWVPPNKTPEFAYYNPDVEEVEVEVNIQLAEYYINILDPRERHNKDAIRRILSRGSPIPYKTVGAPRNPVTYDLAWDVEPVSEKKIRNAVFDNGGS